MCSVIDMHCTLVIAVTISIQKDRQIYTLHLTFCSSQLSSYSHKVSVSAGMSPD